MALARVLHGRSRGRSHAVPSGWGVLYALCTSFPLNCAKRGSFTLVSLLRRKSSVVIARIAGSPSGPCITREKGPHAGYQCPSERRIWARNSDGAVPRGNKGAVLDSAWTALRPTLRKPPLGLRLRLGRGQWQLGLGGPDRG